MDQPQRFRLAPLVLFHELSRLAAPRIFPDIAYGQSDVGEQLFNFLDSIVRFKPGALARHRLRRIRMVFREFALKKLRKIVFDVVRVQIVLEVFIQETSQRFTYALAKQAPFQAAVPQDLPLRKEATPAMNISSIISTGFIAAQKRARSCGIFAREERRRAKQR
jgi:hypothetical protein